MIFFNYVAPPFPCCYRGLRRPSLISCFGSHQRVVKRTQLNGREGPVCVEKGERPPSATSAQTNKSSGNHSIMEGWHCVDYLLKQVLSAHFPIHERSQRHQSTVWFSLTSGLRCFSQWRLKLLWDISCYWQQQLMLGTNAVLGFRKNH